MKSAVLIILTITASPLVGTFPSPGYSGLSIFFMNGRPPSRSRYSRSADPEPQGTLGANLQGDSLNLEYRQNVFGNDRGSLIARTGTQKVPGQSWIPNVGLEGTYRFPQLNPRGSITANWQKDFDGQEHRPSYALGYEHTIFENKHGSICLTAGAQKVPGQSWISTVGLQGTYRFPQRNPQGSITATIQKELNGQDRRPFYGLGYKHTIFEEKDLD